MTAIRARDEILARIRAVEAEDWFGFRREVLIDALDFEHAREFLRPEVTSDQWRPALDHPSMLAQATAYYDFALGKIRDHRGISASRSVDKLTEFAWLLCRDDVVAAMDSGKYEQYGAPKVKTFGSGFGLAWPDDPAMKRMADGEPCEPGCAMGCGR
ncbi:hypothetical protein [Nonomuraea sp. NPDC049750]|uniref:hypothetical protein n=1 Tax=Nonomuraea sp. NPDC049750 TaxID=3154738 RepID=UPI0033FB3ABC